MLVTEEVGNRVEINGAVLEVVMCQFAARILQHLLKGEPRIRQPALERARAGAHFAGGVLKGRALAGQGPLEGTLDLIACVCAGVALLKLGFQVGPNGREQFRVVGYVRTRISCGQVNCLKRAMRCRASRKDWLQTAATVAGW